MFERSKAFLYRNFTNASLLIAILAISLILLKNDHNNAKAVRKLQTSLVNIENQFNDLANNAEAVRKLQTSLINIENQFNDLTNKYNPTKYNPTIFDYFDLTKAEEKKLLKLSKSQLKQDIFVYLELDKKKNGYFVEFGATDGFNLSNSYMLGNHFGWKGILAEPAIIWHENLAKNRPNAVIDKNCIWTEDGAKIVFNQTELPELSTIDKLSDLDGHKKARVNGQKYEVNTITLLSLLVKHNAPAEIDYLSIDTEGSELAILETFFINNTFYKIKIITCEHNFTESREKIHELLIKYGYERKYQDVSQWDDFYVLKD